MDFLTVLENTALICTIGSNFSGLPICWRFYKKKSTLRATVIPFLAGVLCTCLWLQYSVYIGNAVLTKVNGIAVTMQTIYVACFYLYAQDKMKVQRQASPVFVSLLLIYIFGFHILSHEVAERILGLAASGFTIVAMASPFVTLGEVLKTRNSQSLNFPMIASTLVVSFLWFSYGWLLKNSVIMVPNLVGVIFALIQLGLIYKFPAKDDASLKKD